MDGTKSRELYPIVGASTKPRWVGGHDGHCKTQGVSLSGAVVGADLGSSSKYSNENFEG